METAGIWDSIVLCVVRPQVQVQANDMHFLFSFQNTSGRHRGYQDIAQGGEPSAEAASPVTLVTLVMLVTQVTLVTQVMLVTQVASVIECWNTTLRSAFYLVLAPVSPACGQVALLMVHTLLLIRSQP